MAKKIDTTGLRSALYNGKKVFLMTDITEKVGSAPESYFRKNNLVFKVKVQGKGIKTENRVMISQENIDNYNTLQNNKPELVILEESVAETEAAPLQLEDSIDQILEEAKKTNVADLPKTNIVRHTTQNDANNNQLNPDSVYAEVTDLIDREVRKTARENGITDVYSEAYGKIRASTRTKFYREFDEYMADILMTLRNKTLGEVGLGKSSRMHWDNNGSVRPPYGVIINRAGYLADYISFARNYFKNLSKKS